MKKNFLLTSIILIALLSLFFLESFFRNKNDINGSKASQLSTWVVYWDEEDVSSEIDYIQLFIEEIISFAAYFDKNNEIFIPENMINLHLSLKSSLDDTSIVHYISVVNDKINKDGSSSLKDKELLYSLLVNEKEREEHIRNLVDLCLENGYDGLEIDYEGLKNDETLWPYFLEFCSSLYEALSFHDLKMRVVLEPSAPIEIYNFPQGPTYVMMCYNLYGIHSGPGPKADGAFLEKLSLKTQGLPGKTNFALATGGFNWDSDGGITAITEEEANDLMRKYKVEPTRDKDSQCLVFQYIEENNIHHEVWFADGITLSNWINLLKNKGNENFSLWRLNGNKKESLLMIGELTTEKLN